MDIRRIEMKMFESIRMRRLASMILLPLFTLLLAAPAATGAGFHPDGTYLGRYDGKGSKPGEIKLKVKRDGRQIRSFRTVTTAVCVNPNAIGGIEVLPTVVTIDRVRITRRGRFSRQVKLIDKDRGYRQVYRLKGRFAGRKLIRGRLVLEGRCAAKRSFRAKRKR